MENEIEYESPKVEVIEVEVEHGFALSGYTSEEEWSGTYGG